MSQASVEALTKAFVQLRDERAEIKKIYDEADFKLKAKMDKIELMLMSKLKEFGIDSFKTPFGTVFTQEQTRYTCADWDSYWQACLDSGHMDWLEKRVSQGAMKGLAEEGIELPPGIEYTSERVVRVRRN